MIACALALAGCATATPFPSKRPLTQAGVDAIGQTSVVVNESEFGVAKSWFMTDSSATGAQYGLIGAIVSATMDAIINAGPSRRAHKAANEIAEFVPAQALNASLVTHLNGQIAAADAPRPTGVSVGSVATRQRILTPTPAEKAVEISTDYTLSEDASVLRVTAHASYQSASMTYATPYTFKGTPPKSELSGPVYANTFTYYSSQVPVPVMSPELQQRLIASIEETYRDASGAPPAADSPDFKAMTKELEDARDDKFTKSEIAIFLTREWLKDGAAPLKAEVERAHAFIAKYVVLDLNTTTVPALTGEDELLETADDQRTVRRIGSSVQSGSYVSSPGGVSSFSTYGNAVRISKGQEERLKQLRDQASQARAAARARR